MARLRSAGALLLLLAMAGCGDGKGGFGGSAQDKSARAVNDAAWDAARLEAKPDPRGFDPAILRVQVLLDRARFSPGAINGRAGPSLNHAIAAFQSATGAKPDGVLTRGVFNRLTMADPRPAIRAYVIDADDVAGPFNPDIPAAFEAMARLEQLNYHSPAEELAETFHMDEALLKALNPGADFKPGSTVLVADRGDDDLGADVARVEVDRPGAQVRAYALDGHMMAAYPASVGSKSCPAFVGRTTVKSIAAQPTYSYDSDSLGVAGSTRGRLEIAAGPNNPIGVVWIELARDGYGLHGSADPGQVGKAGAAGCVRLTNWDARELARGVVPGIPVDFR